MVLELLQHGQRVGGGTKGAIELGGDDDVALAASCSRRLPSGRSASGVEPDTPRSTNCSATVQPFIMA